jgi:CBS domain-containing protein
MITVRQLLDIKGREVLSIGRDATVYTAIAEMARHRIGALLVVANGRLAGIVSERDYLTKVALLDRSSRETPVSTIMTTTLVTISEEQTLTDCMRLMTERRIRHLPVLDGDRPIGMISIGDVLKQTLSEHEETIRQLESYISGAG